MSWKTLSFNNNIKVSFNKDLSNPKDLPIRESRGGIRSAIARVPLGAGLKLLEARRLKVGWALCRIKEFDVQAQMCNKCREKGHFAKTCSGKEKRSCFRCRKVGHLIAECREQGGSAPEEPRAES